MPLEAKRSRHGTIAIPIVAVGGVVTVRPGEQRSQPQQPDVAYSQTLIGGPRATRNRRKFSGEGDDDGTSGVPLARPDFSTRAPAAAGDADTGERAANVASAA